MNNIIITNTQGNDFKEDIQLQQFIAEAGFSFIPREKKSLHHIASEHHADFIIVWQHKGPVVYYNDMEIFFFHPSMSKNRISNYRKLGQKDNLAQACAIEKHDEILDCTMGLGADAIVLSYFAEQGRVVGLEFSQVVYLIVKWGMKLYYSKMPWLEQAIKRIEPRSADHKVCLQQCPDNHYDIVYFDPMFRQPVWKSKAISPLRSLGIQEPLSRAVIQEACRVALKRVVLKEKSDSGEFERLGFRQVLNSKNNPIAYGVIALNK